MNEIVKYHNCMNGLKFKKFTKTDLNMLMVLCSKIKDKELNKVCLSFEEIKKLSEYTSTDKSDFVSDLKRMNDRLMSVTCNFETENRILMFVLFPTFDLNLDNETLTVSVNSDFKFILNELVSNFTRFELQEFVNLESKYSKTLYRLLKQFKGTGFYKIGIEDFKEKMDCPKSYSNKYITDKIIKPSILELNAYFENLSFKTKTARKKGAPVIGYEFRFEPEEQIPGQKNILNYIPNPTQKKKHNKFNNFEQREDYNFVDLERKLLGVNNDDE